MESGARRRQDDRARVHRHALDSRGTAQDAGRLEELRAGLQPRGTGRARCRDPVRLSQPRFRVPEDGRPGPLRCAAPEHRPAAREARDRPVLDHQGRSGSAHLFRALARPHPAGPCKGRRRRARVQDGRCGAGEDRLETDFREARSGGHQAFLRRVRSAAAAVTGHRVELQLSERAGILMPTGGRPDGLTASRREALVAGAGLVAGLVLPREVQAARPSGLPAARLKQSASRWCYRSIALPDLCKAGKAMGLAGIDLLAPEDWPVVRQNGLVCSMGYAAIRDDFIPRGFNDPANHDLLVGELERALPLAQQHGVPNLIAMFGNRQGRSDEQATEACVTGLKRIAPSAERYGVTICVELLNSKVDHKDYQGDRTAFGANIIAMVGSPRVKLLYDIYHMQIMEGDVIRTIRQHASHIGHFHTGGVPGRHELDDTQELNYHAVARAIADP